LSDKRLSNGLASLVCTQTSLPACALFAVLAAALACNDGGPPLSGKSGTADRKWTEQERWKISSSPAQVLGETSADPDAEFGDIRGAVASSDGRIAVADAWADAIRVFSRSGRLVRTIGRSGAGPGEFSDPGGLYLLVGDTMALWDRATARITLFDFDGHLAGTERVAGPRRLIAGVLSGHNLVTFVDIDRLGQGVVKGNPFHVFVVGFDGTEKHRTGTYVARQLFMLARDNITFSTEYVLSPRTYVAGAGRFFAVGNSGSDSVMLYGTDADLRAILRIPSAVRATTAADVRYYVDRIAPEGGTRIEQLMREAHIEMVETVEIPDVLPRFAGIHLDSDGHVWVEEYPRPDQPQHKWYVFDSEGTFLGEVSGPEKSERILHIGRSLMLAFARGDLDVPLVKAYAIEKPSDNERWEAVAPKKK
jgi:hypothetical protein